MISFFSITLKFSIVVICMRLQVFLVIMDAYNPRVIQGLVQNLDSFRLSGFKGK